MKNHSKAGKACTSIIHLTNTRGLWFWSITEAGQAVRSAVQGFVNSVDAQAEARAVVGMFRRLETLGR